MTTFGNVLLPKLSSIFKYPWFPYFPQIKEKNMAQQETRHPCMHSMIDGNGSNYVGYGFDTNTSMSINASVSDMIYFMKSFERVR